MKYSILSLVLMLALSCSINNEHNVAIITGGHGYDSVNFVKLFQSYPDLYFDHLLHPEANSIYGSDSIDKYDVIVFYDLYQDITEDQKSDFIKMLEKGKGLVFLHHSIASYQDWDEFKSILGARYYLQDMQVDDKLWPASTYLDDQKVEVSILDDKHPVTKGLEDFEIHEEVYDLVELMPDNELLMGTDHPESVDFLVWTNEYKKSRIVYIQFGHDNNAYSNPNFRKLLRQAISWAGK